jgi:tetratricopeptide (TPR) repeat protein
MLTEFRRKLGKLKDRLERRVESMSGSRRREAGPISEADREFMLGWIMGKATDEEVVARAKAGAGLALIDRACAARPSNALMCAVRAQYLLEDEELVEALFHAERAFVLGRLEPLSGLVLVRARAASGDASGALEIVPVALENARRVQAHAVRLEVCEAWRALEPGSIEPVLEEARTHAAANDYAAAVAKLRKLLADTGPNFIALMLLGATYQDLARNEDALAAYLQAVEAEPGNVDALCMAGLCARDLGDREQADQLLTRACEADPASSFAQYSLGMLRMEQERIDEASALFLGARNSSRGAPWTGPLEPRLATATARDIGSPDWATARFKLDHDIEQLEYLRSKGLVDASVESLIAGYRKAVFDGRLPVQIYDMVGLVPAEHPLLAATYKMPLHAPDPDPPSGALANPSLAWAAIEERYLAAEPRHAVVDGLLSPQALEALRAYCLESTVWNDLKGGYLGASLADGFAGRLLLRIASELRTKLPRVLGDKPLRGLWAYKYDSRYTGIGVHADPGAVSINFWLTPDVASLDTEAGGLLLYPATAPAHWSAQRFAPREDEIRAHLVATGAKAIKVPYRENRAVLFDSSLLHESDAFRFAEGYENRRINLTFVYGAPAA